MNKQWVISKVNSNAISNYIGQSYSVLITLASIPILIKYLGAEAYGLIGVFMLLQSFIVIFDFGLSATINHKIARARVNTNDFKTLVDILKISEILFFLISIVLMASIYYGSTALPNKWIKPVLLEQNTISYCLQLMGLIIGLKLYTTFYRSGINGFEDQIWNNKNNILISTLKYGGAIILVIFFSQEVKNYFEYQLLIAFVEVMILRKRIYKKTLNHTNYSKSLKINWTEFSKIIPFSLSVAFTSGIVVITMQLDKILLSSMIGLEAFGYLSLVSTVTSLIFIMVTPIFSAYLPKITTLATKNQIVEMTAVYRQMTKIVTLITASVTATIACNAHGILYVIAGNKAAQAWGAEILIYYAIGTGFYVLGSAQYYILNALGNLKLYVICCTVSLFVLTPIIFIVAQTYSVLGTSYTWMIYGFAWFIIWGAIVHHEVLPKFHTQWLLKDIAPLLISVIITAFIASIVMNVGESDSRALIMVKSLTLGIVILLINALWLNSFRDLILKNKKNDE